MKGIRRAVFILIVGLLLAAVPASAVAGEGILRTSIRGAEAQFDADLTWAIANGLDAMRAATLMWRYHEVVTARPGAWWQAVAFDHDQLAKLGQLEADLRTGYTGDLAERRDAFIHGLHSWSRLLSDANVAGIAADDLDTVAGLVRDGRQAATPNDFNELSDGLTGQIGILEGRLTAYRAAESQTQATLESARTLLVGASEYPELNLHDFKTQVATAASDLASTRTMAGFQAIANRLQQTSVAVHNLLEARAAAYAQLADARATLGSAQSIGADLGDRANAISSLADQLTSAADQGSFESVTGKLLLQKQALDTAIWLNENAPVGAVNLGAGKVIVVSLSRQALTAYEDGNPVLTALVATGRPELNTPPGIYHVFARLSSFYMVSPWGYGSPYWYPRSFIKWGLEFRAPGYFIHDAPWRSWYGPGANIHAGTHGCINVPHSPMLTLWQWAPIGTTVIVEN